MTRYCRLLPDADLAALQAAYAGDASGRRPGTISACAEARRFARPAGWDARVSEPIRVPVVDDQVIFRHGLEATPAAEAGEARLFEAIRAGAVGHLPKSRSMDEIATAVRSVSRG